MAKIGFINQFLNLELHLDDGTTGKYPRAYVYNSSNTLVDDLIMSPGNTSGTYTAQYVPLVAGYYYFVFKVYTTNLYNLLDTDYNIPYESAYVYNREADAEYVAGKVWDVVTADHQTAGTTGKTLYTASTNTGGGGGSVPPELTPERIEKLDNLDVAVSTRATQASVNSVLAALSSISSFLSSMATNALTAAQVWAFGTRGLTETVAVNNVDLSPLATKVDLDNAVTAILAGLDSWEAKGSVTINPGTDTMELVAWLTKNGSVILDADSASVELRDGDDNIVMAPITDTAISASGLFKFTRNGASAIIFKNRTYVMRISITRGTDTYNGNVSISTY